MNKQIKTAAVDYSTLTLAWKMVGTTTAKKTAAVAAVSAAYEMVATEIVALATSQGVHTGAASDLFLHGCKVALLGTAEETTQFSSMWERAVKVSFAIEGSPLTISAKRKADQAKTVVARQTQAASKMIEAGVKQAPAKAAIIAALNADMTGVLTLNLLKALEAMKGGVLIVRMAKVEPEAKPAAKPATKQPTEAAWLNKQLAAQGKAQAKAAAVVGKIAAKPRTTRAAKAA